GANQFPTTFRPEIAHSCLSTSVVEGIRPIGANQANGFPLGSSGERSKGGIQLKRTRLAVVAMLAVVLPSLTQAADARPVRPRRGVSAVFGDPEYGSPTSDSHDAALLRLTSSVTGITPIVLAGSGDDGLEADGVILTVIGWGTLRTGKQLYPDALYKVDVPVV